MDDILDVLGRYCSFLYKQYGFRIVDSKVYPPDFYEGELTMESHGLRLRFVSDRKQVFLEFQPIACTSGKHAWSDVDLVLSHIEGKTIENSMVTKDNAQLLDLRMNDVIAAFQPESVQSTLAGVQKYLKARGKAVRLSLKKFGPK